MGLAISDPGYWMERTNIVHEMNKLYRGCLLYLRDSEKDIKGYFKNSDKLLNLLINPKDSEYIWMNRSDDVDRLIRKLEEVRPILEMMPSKGVGLEDAERAKMVLDEIISYLMTELYRDWRREVKFWIDLTL
ncbi:MAG: hypothetical protein DRP11_00685 [Candidatus Aenigmatarchaeota archaeon]|nr:MAG: hypothetical protein DRP11_00685 [Candidatus Aenigmarchaeota archaeon]